jgi:hypothetical protein
MKWRDRKPNRHISTKSKISHSVEHSSHEQETFKDTKWIIRRGKSKKDRQYNKTMQNHTSVGHQQLFASNITVMSWLCPWSSKSPDRNPVEHI